MSAEATHDTAPVLEVRGLRKSFGDRRVLDGVDLVVPAGSITAVLGPSGCGKTTLLRIVAGFEHPDAGTVTVRGVRVAGEGTDVPPERRRVGVVPQEGALFPHLDVRRNVGFGLPRGAASTERIRACLELVGLADRADARPDQLSGGQQQRVALARALAPNPSLVVLDEPFSALDTALRAKVRDEVVGALRAAGATAVFVTHDQEEALSTADRVGVLLNGRVAQCGEPIELYRAPASIEVARFLGEAVVLPGELDRDVVRCALGAVVPGSVPPGASSGSFLTVVVRPEQIVPSADGVGATAGETTYFGHDGLVRLHLDDGTEVDARWAPPLLPRPGDRVGVRVVGEVAVYAAPGPGR
ncbi:MAG: ABC transporter ATP-binding protein [Actinobacteria bacterium]|nr:ABC transporter ATP-binding protein [Actinomycetota bacterium]